VQLNAFPQADLMGVTMAMCINDDMKRVGKLSMSEERQLCCRMLNVII